jgi:hypothetical protein
MRFFRLCAFIATIAVPPALAGCAPPVSAGNQAPLPSPDGVWRGSSTRFQVVSRQCPRPRLMTVSVQNSGFAYPWTPGSFIAVTIAPDGTLSGAQDDIAIKGKYTPGQITGDASNGLCGLHFTLMRQ